MTSKAFRAAHGTYITVDIAYDYSAVVLTVAGHGKAVIDWGDGSPALKIDLQKAPADWSDMLHKTDWDFAHNYTGAGERQISIIGTVSSFSISSDAPSGRIDTGQMPSLLHAASFWEGLTALNVGENDTLEDIFIEDGMLETLNIYGCPSLSLLSITNNRLERMSLIEIFNALPNRSEKIGGVLSFSGNPGSDMVLVESIAMVLPKNWEVVE